MAKFVTNASGAMLLPDLVQVTESISGSVVPLAMFFTFVEILQISKANVLSVLPYPSHQER